MQSALVYPRLPIEHIMGTRILSAFVATNSQEWMELMSYLKTQLDEGKEQSIAPGTISMY